MSRYYLIYNAFDAIEDELASDPEADEAWDRAVDELLDLMFETVETEDSRGVFEDPGSAALGTVLMEHLSRYTRRHVDAEDLSTHVNEVYPAYVETLFTSPAFAAAVDLFNDVSSDAEDQALFDDLLLYLVEETETAPRPIFAALYDVLVGSMDEISYLQVAPFYASLVDPDRRFDVEGSAELPLLTHGALVLRSMLDVDPESVALDLLDRGLQPMDGGDNPLTIVGQVIRQIHRRGPGTEALTTPADLANIYLVISNYIRDDMRGVERMFQLIQDRGGAQR